MQRLLSWDDARILLAVTRNGTQASASKALGIDQATVSRHLLRLEDVVGAALFLRDGTRLVPTETARFPSLETHPSAGDQVTAIESRAA